MTDTLGLHATPTLECDIVMKGGITSGVIYPRAVAELARTYRLRSVGGASAGAIAASAAAAAELGRLSGGFDELDRMPRDLTAPGPDGRSRLATLFQPTRAAAPLFRVLESLDGKQGPAGTAVKVLGVLFQSFWLAALLFALPGIVLVVLSAMGEGVARVAGIVGGALLLLLGLLAGILVAVARRMGTIAGDGFGFCTGMAGVGAGDSPALMPWMHSKLQSMAARPAGAPPLTFGDLDDAGLTLRMMTTNLTRHQPMAMPWATREYFFDPDYFRTLFPEDVVDHMVAHPPRSDGSFSTQVLRAQAGNLRPWPDPGDLPIIVATRMSLSFPLLICAVRLHAVDYNEPGNREARDAVGKWRRANPEGTVEQAVAALRPPEFSPVWFTDGGLCANLPVHFFDTPLPKRPTFAFNLNEFPPGWEKSTDQAENSYLPTTNTGGISRPWFDLRTSGVGSWVSFGMLMVHTAREWVDGEQLIMPGYRDRIVTVFHDDAEGGMNLNMPEPVVTDLAERGRQGALKLLGAFAGDAPGVTPARGWNNHRWIRFRTATAGLSGWLERFRGGYRDTTSGGVPYPDLAGPGASAELPSYKLTKSQRERVNLRTEGLVDLADDWSGDDSLTDGAPRPRPRLRLVPDDGAADGRGATPNPEDPDPTPNETAE